MERRCRGGREGRKRRPYGDWGGRGSEEEREGERGRERKREEEIEEEERANEKVRGLGFRKVKGLGFRKGKADRLRQTD